MESVINSTVYTSEVKRVVLELGILTDKKKNIVIQKTSTIHLEFLENIYISTKTDKILY
jgi:hypothetical protein